MQPKFLDFREMYYETNCVMFDHSVLPLININIPIFNQWYYNLQYYT